MIVLSNAEKEHLMEILCDAWGYACDSGDIDLANRISDFQVRIETGRKLEALND